MPGRAAVRSGNISVFVKEQMLKYNTHNEPLRMPEYGRYVQGLVDKCLTIEDRAERNAYARGIVYTICNLFPQQKTNPEWRAKLWDHLAIMSDFKLDIDYPVEITMQEDFESRPAHVPLPGHDIVLRQYGNNVQQMIATATAMDPEDPDREEFTILIANHMKKLMLQINPDGVEDERIFKDLEYLSHGQLRLNSDSNALQEFNIVAAPGSKKKKRKR
ncbi:MAG: DUF4290 domain-containing protein [Muribaculaceae bacterium]|nr:DUF4290 domain-containing protein [Muribaculaceae bacterium]